MNVFKFVFVRIIVDFVNYIIFFFFFSAANAIIIVRAQSSQVRSIKVELPVALLVKLVRRSKLLINFHGYIDIVIHFPHPMQYDG